MAIKGTKNNKYSYETKHSVVTRYLEGESRKDLMKEYGVRNDSQVEEWVRIYKREGNEGLKPKQRGRRKKTIEQTEIERLRMENEILKKIQDLLEQEKP